MNGWEILVLTGQNNNMKKRFSEWDLMNGCGGAVKIVIHPRIYVPKTRPVLRVKSLSDVDIVHGPVHGPQKEGQNIGPPVPIYRAYFSGFG